jgi:predicted DNA-binding mobile mystery protein A
MNRNYHSLQAEQLDSKLNWLRAHRHELVQGFWIRSIREALSMSTYQLAKRIGVAQPTLAEWESREKDGTISMESLRKIADALECDLVYALVPRKKLRKLMEEQALQLATQIVDDVAHSMKLESQGTTEARRHRAIKEQARLLLEQSPGRIWDDQPKRP